MAINYSRVNWDTTKFVNPTNMNQMDKGIKDACDKLDTFPSSFAWTPIQNVESSSNTTTTVSVSGYTEVLVEYGIKNGGQSYGGGVIHGFVGMNKPCFLPLYYSVATSPHCIAYIFFSRNDVIVSNASATNTILFRIYAR